MLVQSCICCAGYERAGNRLNWMKDSNCFLWCNVNIIFDLDGTIVDSAPLIVECFREVLRRAGKLEGAQLDYSLIGPPLRESMARLSGSEDPADAVRLVDEFRLLYDQQVAERTPAYADMEQLFASLKEAGFVLHVATNKLEHPTRKILVHLGLAGIFENIYAIDSAVPAYASKAEMIAALPADSGINPGAAVYVGDKREDGEAADRNELRFFAVAWGYGDWKTSQPAAHWNLVMRPAQLQSALLQCMRG